MKFLFGLLGAVLGLAAGFFYVGNWAAEWLVANRPQESPDDVMATHSLAFLATAFVLLVIGWFLGSWIGGFFAGREEE